MTHALVVLCISFETRQNKRVHTQTIFATFIHIPLDDAIIIIITIHQTDKIIVKTLATKSWITLWTTNPPPQMHSKQLPSESTRQERERNRVSMLAQVMINLVIYHKIISSLRELWKRKRKANRMKTTVQVQPRHRMQYIFGKQSIGLSTATSHHITSTK